MNDMQPGTPTTNVYVDTFLFSQDVSHTISRPIPDTLASAIPDTTPDMVEMLVAQDTLALPALNLPQVAPSQVIAMRQRSLTPTPLPYVPTRATISPRLPMVQQQKSVQPVSGSNPYSTNVAPLTPRPQTIGMAPITPMPDNASYRRVSKLNGITYIPRSMKRQEPTVVDALVACGTLILICLCVMLFLYYIGL